ncbi:MAG: AbrB/MazE/SpoVT family DNA-binding domain-containing protein [Patescibacteria group bacterium]
MNISTVTTKGQATIPEEIRRLLNINVGDKIIFLDPIKDKKQAMIQVLSQSNTVDNLFGSLKTNIPYTDIKTVREKAGFELGKKYNYQLQFLDLAKIGNNLLYLCEDKNFNAEVAKKFLEEMKKRIDNKALEQYIKYY